MGGLDSKAHVNRLAKLTSGMTVEEIVAQEVFEIVEASKSAATNNRPLRLHVFGDCPSAEAARELAGAVEVWKRNGGGPVWSYSHNWASMKRADWGSISVLASVDNPAQARLAAELGYTPAVVVRDCASKAWDEEGVRWLVCPAQRRDTVCLRCRLCWSADKLGRAGRGVAFLVHGSATSIRKARREVTSMLGVQLSLFEH